jgi:hypothetical protein
MRSKSVNKYKRDMQEFLSDQQRKEEDRKTKINMQKEFENLKAVSEVKQTPDINLKSKKLIEKKQ